ncbi:MAG: sulfurtransferase TusA family protein [Alphaproteobacteria bacterium]|nr:sulfurtransferase TusA family protein [Alphaproteobacteria bacterium]
MSDDPDLKALAPDGAQILDVRGFACPLPVLKTRKAIKSVDDGGLLLVVATDPAAPLDFEVYCHRAGNPLEEQWQKDDLFGFLIRKGGAAA